MVLPWVVNSLGAEFGVSSSRPIYIPEGNYLAAAIPWLFGQSHPPTAGLYVVIAAGQHLFGYYTPVGIASFVVGILGCLIMIWGITGKSWKAFGLDSN